MRCFAKRKAHDHLRAIGAREEGEGASKNLKVSCDNQRALLDMVESLRNLEHL